MTLQALTLIFCTQMPGQQMLKVTDPPKKKHHFCNTSHYKSKDVSLAIIYFVVGDLLSCFQSVFRMAGNVAARIVSESDALCQSCSRSRFEYDW